MGAIHGALCDAIGYPVRFTAHWLRHTYISLLASKGVHPVVAAAMAGHSKPSTTLDVYSHAMVLDKKDAAERL